MADVATASGADGPAGETPGQQQARLRREKRQKKMAAEGEGRLEKIKALNGGVAPPEEVLGGPAAPAPNVASVDDDPEEVDIGSLPSPPINRSARSQENPLASAFMQMQGGQQQAAGQGQGQGGQDPMMAMMQQMMGSMGGGSQDPNNPGAQPDLPQMLQSLMGGQQQAQQENKAVTTTGPAYLWKIVHAIFASILASYIALTSTFNGTMLSRSQSVYSDQASYGIGPRLFVIFTTAELVLQSMRYYVEGGRVQGTGMFATVANMGIIPQPYANYIRIIGSYVAIGQTIFKDAMVVVFVFGCLAWWNDLAAASV